MGDENKVRYYRIVMAWWEFCKRNLDDNHDEAFWTKCVDDVRFTIQNSHPDDMDLLTKMINALLGDMQERDINGKGK